jgi:prefoldin subunit 5
MFNRNINEAIEILYDSIYLLTEEIKEIREEVNYLSEILDND